MGCSVVRAVIAPAVAPLPALTAQFAPPPVVAQPPRMVLPVLALMMLTVPVMPKSTAVPTGRLTVPRLRVVDAMVLLMVAPAVRFVVVKLCVPPVFE